MNRFSMRFKEIVSMRGPFPKLFGALARKTLALFRSVFTVRLAVRVLVAAGCIVLFSGVLQQLGLRRLWIAGDYTSSMDSENTWAPSHESAIPSGAISELHQEVRQEGTMELEGGDANKPQPGATSAEAVDTGAKQPDATLAEIADTAEKQANVTPVGVADMGAKQPDTSTLQKKPDAVLAKPVAGEVAASFGWVYSTVLDQWYFHPGTDYLAQEGAEVYASAGGVVLSTATGAYGTQVRIDHGNGLVTTYAGCKDIRVKPGDSVKPGQAIARVGKPGNREPDERSRVHFEVMFGEESVDPQTVVK